MSAMSTAPRVLLFSPNLDGHRQVYCQVLAEHLTAEGFAVTIAGALADGRGEYPYVTALRSAESVTLLDTGCLPGGGRGVTLDGLRGLQTKTGADVTVIAEADDYLPLLASQIGGRKLHGRTIGVFLRSMNFVYANPSPRERFRRLRHLSARWRSDGRLFHGFLLERFKLLHEALVLDEYFAASHQGRHQWLPDIFAPTRELPQAAGQGSGHWAEILAAFRARNGGRHVLLYFGTAQARRGYALLLRLAVDEDACFIHCGLPNDGETYDENVRAMRQTLSSRGSLLETNAFIDDKETVDLFFQSADRMVLPYSHFHSSSGVMLQALSYGHPVLVAPDGLMGRRVTEHGLGKTTPTDRYDALREAVRLFFAEDAAIYQPAIRTFLGYFTPEQVSRAVLHACRGKGELPRSPVAAGGRS